MSARARPLGASGFTATWRVETGEGCYFVKTLPEGRAEVLEAEADGLAALAATRTIRVPAVLFCQCVEGVGAVLALEWLEFAPPERGYGARLGERLAALHAAPPPIAGWGWPRDNFLGATAQTNTPVGVAGRAGWCRFFAEARLGALARRLNPWQDGELQRAVEAVCARLPEFFDDGYEPQPSLIHGDLWSGNHAMLAGGEPVLFDPAVSVSDAEAELAMLELFGVPPEGFWAAYAHRRPVAPGYARYRRDLYQLYHLVNHVLLFGGGYRAQALAVARWLAR
ncbi:MAG: fructosamine kinase family protein [Burkholderiales bacterium]|nr:fructosamine kinase family protein [Burkholderiales bacterium]